GDPVEPEQGAGEFVGLGDAFRRAREVDLDPVARREDHRLVAREGPRQGLQPRGAPRALEGQRLADRGRRGSVIDSHGEQSHGVVTLPAPFAVTAPWAVGSRSASTPTQVKTRNPKATIVSTIMLRPRIS